MKTSLLAMFAGLFAPSTLTMDHSSNMFRFPSLFNTGTPSRRLRIPGRPGKPRAKLAHRVAARTLTNRS